MKRLLVLVSMIASAPAFAQTPPLRLNGAAFHGLSAASGTPTTTDPVTWADTSTRLRLSDGTNNLYIPACAPSVSGQICSWNGSGWTATAVSVTLSQAYTNGSTGPQTITLDSTRKGIQIVENSITSTPFEVTDTGSNPYLRAVGTHDPFYGSYPGLLVYQHINGWNGNTLYLGDMQFATSSIQL